MTQPIPDIADMPYGPHARNTMDVYKVPDQGAGEPVPVLIHLHGGGFKGGDKHSLSEPLLNRARAAGICVVSINYRLSQQAPYPAPMLDAARALQFMRANAGAWNIDPRRIASEGISAGAGISLWLNFHEDLAKPDSDDIVERESTRPTCVACLNGQSSYDPNLIRSIIPGPAGDHAAMQMLFRAPLEKQQEKRFQPAYDDCAALTHVSRDAGPVYLCYFIPDAPLTEPLPAEVGIHHPVFGKLLKERMDAVGLECILRRKEEFPDADHEALREAYAAETIAFCMRHFATDLTVRDTSR